MNPSVNSNNRSRSPVYSTNLPRVRRDSVSPSMAERIPLVVVNDKPVTTTENNSEPRTDSTQTLPTNGEKTSDSPRNNSSDETTHRAIPDGGSEIPENTDVNTKPDLQPHHYSGTLYPYSPSTRNDLEVGSFLADGESIPDVNVYQHKKTLAQGMMDLALFSANANQLRYVLESYNRHPYYFPSLIFISISLIFQVAIGIGLTWNATYNVKDKKEICIANKINNFTIIGIFIVTVVNVFISAFGVANAAPNTAT